MFMFNFFDFLMGLLGNTGIIGSLARILSRGGKGISGAVNAAAARALKEPKAIAGFIKTFLNDPRSLATGLSQLTPQELAQLNNAIDAARDMTLKKKVGEKVEDEKLQMFEESKALSSTWLVHGLYVGNKISGTITITTIQGKSYNFPIPINYSTWNKMKNTRGRAGSGAGSIFHAEYWSKIRKTKAKIKEATIFRLAGYKGGRK